MKTRLLVLISLLLLLVAGCSVQPARQLESQKVPVRLALLKGSVTYPVVKGTATYKVDNNGIREFQAVVENALVLKGKTVSVFVGTRNVGSMTINALGRGVLRLVGLAAPVINPNTTPVIRVRTPTGVLVASGVMNLSK
jgi:hypothetical protein